MELSNRLESRRIRNSNVEFLRFVLMIAICVWHTMVHGYDYKLMGNGMTPDVQGILLMGFCVPAVDTFMLISGYYGVRLSSDKLLRLVLQALLISNLVILTRYFFFNGSLSFYDQVLPISSGCSWWFMTSYVVIMLMSPILNRGIDNTDVKELGFILCALFFIYSIVQYRLGMNGASTIIMLLVYLLGRYLRKVNLKMSIKGAFALWSLSLLLLYVCMFYFYYHGSYTSIMTLLSYNNPIVIVLAVSILFFTLSLGRHEVRLASFLGAHSLSIYLFSEVLGFTLYKFWSRLLDDSLFLYTFAILSFAILCECLDVPIAKLNSFIRKKIPIRQ